LDPAVRSAQSLAPAIKELLRQAGWNAREIDLFAVTVGPGSFTGLRIGVTTAKTLAYAAQAEVLGVNTLEVIASQAPGEIPRLCAAVDAQRRELFIGRFERGPDGRMQWEGELELVNIDEWLGTLPRETIIAGPGLQRLLGDLPDSHVDLQASPDVRAQARVAYYPIEPTAEGVGRLALHQYRTGRRESYWTLVPLYLRRSAAEEKWDARHNKLV
jgi:tRNA threonylcarbamoyladenosine biosynthesis protein TsaB